MLEIILAQIPEATFFAIFILMCKNEKIKSSKGILLMSLSILQYIVLANIFPYNSWFQFIYLFTLYINCKLIYKTNSNIIDLMYIILGSAFLTIASLLIYIIFHHYMILAVVIHKMFIFILLFAFKNKLNNLDKLYFIYWNRKNHVKKKITSVTFRNIHVITLNLIFIIVNYILIYVVPFLFKN